MTRAPIREGRATSMWKLGRRRVLGLKGVPRPTGTLTSRSVEARLAVGGPCCRLI